MEPALSTYQAAPTATKQQEGVMRFTTQFTDGGGINLTKAMVAAKMRKISAPEGWTEHTKYHWSRMVNNIRLDFWPSKDKWSYAGKTYFGDVDKFIEKTTTEAMPRNGE